MIACLLFVIGLFLSAFFSGSETGFYRVTRLRLVLDASDGVRTAGWLLRLLNNPAVFVATTLIGNNVANYLTSLAVVLGAKSVTNDAQWAELAATLALSPVVFVYGELLPKNLFYHAPNLLLRRGAPLLMLFTVLFAPVSFVLWLLGRLLETLIGQTPLKVQSQLARKELRQLFREGGEAGILRPAQQQISQSLLAVAAQPAMLLAVPVHRVGSVSVTADIPAALRLARRSARPAVLVRSQQGKLDGYVRVIDLRLAGPRAELREHLQPLPQLGRSSSHLAALIELQSNGHDAALIVEGQQQQAVGVVYTSDLATKLLKMQ